MEGDFIRKSCCGATFGHEHHCSHYEAATHSTNVINARNTEIAALREQIRVLTEALGHYADEQHWTSRTGKTDGTVKDWYWGNHGSDNGYDIAQKALKGE
jgi:hypothetical protein